MRAKHSEKRENLKNIEKLKKRVQEKGADGEIADAEFDSIMMGGNKNAKSNKVLQQVKNKFKSKN